MDAWGGSWGASSAWGSSWDNTFVPPTFVAEVTAIAADYVVVTAMLVDSSGSQQ